MKRVASHYIYVPEEGYLRQTAIEMEQGRVVRLFPLEGEPEDTLWLPGVVALVTSEMLPLSFCSGPVCSFSVDLSRRMVGRKALYYSAFDFNCWQPAYGTLHTQLL